MKKLLENTRILPKILSAIMTLGLIAIGISLYYAHITTRIDERYSVVTSVEFPSTVNLVRSARMVTDMVKLGNEAALQSNAAAVTAKVRKTEESHRQAIATLREAAALDNHIAGHVQDVSPRIDAVSEKIRTAVEALEAGERERGIQLLQHADEEAEIVLADMVVFNQQRLKKAEMDTIALQTSTVTTNIWTLALSILFTFGCTGLSYYIARNGTVRPLLAVESNLRRLADGNANVGVPCTGRQDEVGQMCRAVQVLRDASLERNRLTKEKELADAEQKVVVDSLSMSLDRLAGGDLTVAIDTDFSGDYAALKTNFNGAVDKLRELIGSVADSAEQIRTGSAEIAQASEDLARRTGSNAASLEQTAAGIGQMDGRLKATANAATQTVERADQTKTVVASGRSVADEAVQAMGRVSDSAKGIDSVIEGLDKIAFQTRVLAMNAAVEAGRAGEAGRGFAVVADLVSALAMRAEEEAKRARDQLTVTQADVVTAVQAVEKVDGALQNISGDVEQVHALLATTAADNQAQAGAITEINSAIASMDQATQQNAAMVEETSAAARNLLTEVQTLAESAGQFQTGQERTARTAPPARTPRKGKEGAYVSPVRPLPAEAIAALTRGAEDDWREF